MSIFSHFQQRFEATRQEEYSLQEYLELCKNDRSTYATAAERLLMAIGEPELVDTSTDSRLSRIFSNKVIRRYPAFADFHGMEECIDQIVSTSAMPRRAWRKRSRFSTCSARSAAASRRWRKNSSC